MWTHVNVRPRGSFMKNNKAKDSKDYALQWKSHLTEILYGPVLDLPYTENKLKTKMRDTITDLCGQIDEVAAILVKQGTFSE